MPGMADRNRSDRSSRGSVYRSRVKIDAASAENEAEDARNALPTGSESGSISPAALSGLDSTARAGVMRRLQREHGNSYVQRVVSDLQEEGARLRRHQAETVQRQQANPVHAAAEAEWKAHPKIHAHFANGLQDYEDLRPLYQAKGIADPAAYLDQHIVQVTFFGHTTPAHDDMASPLQTAEKTLTTASTTPSITSFWAFVPRRIAGGGLSNHALGRAVDINPGGNPHVKAQQEIVVIQAVTGVDLGQSQAAADMRKASQDFQKNFNQAWVDAQKQQLTDLRAQKAPAAQIKAQADLVTAIAAHRAALNGYASGGFLNLEQDLIDALTGAGFGWGGDYQHSKDFMHFELP